MSFRIFLILAASVITLWSQTKRPAKIISHTEPIMVKPLGILNSAFNETNMCITPDGKYLFYMSSRGGKPWSTANYHIYKGKPQYDGDIYYSKKTGEGDADWSAPVALTQNVNSAQAEDEPMVSQDGQRVYFQSWESNWERNGGPYYMSDLKGISWGTKVGMGGGINDFFMESQDKFGSPFATDGAAISPDGKYFFVAAGPDYDGPMDIYVSIKTSSGWSYPQKLALNTPYDERSVHISADGKTIYFASAGYQGFGGLDIYKTTLNPDGTNGEVINLGAPFNTAADDYGFVIMANGKTAYFLRNQDIYYADIHEVTQDIKPTATLIVDGRTFDLLTKQSKGAKLNFLDGSGKIIATASSNNVSGEYSVVLPPTLTSIHIQVSSTGYSNFDSVIHIPSGTGFKEIKLDVPLKHTPAPEDIKKPAPLTMFFDSHNSQIPEKYKADLKSLATYLSAHPGAHVEIVGYYDPEGNAMGPQILTDRNKNIGTFLINSGAKLTQLNVKQYKIEGGSASSGHEHEADARKMVLTILE